MEELERKIKEVEASIKVVEQQIEDVEGKIEDVERQIQTTALTENERAYLQQEKVQLRTKKEQLRKEKEQLRTKEDRLRTKEEQLRRLEILRGQDKFASGAVSDTKDDDSNLRYTQRKENLKYQLFYLTTDQHEVPLFCNTAVTLELKSVPGYEEEWSEMNEESTTKVQTALVEKFGDSFEKLPYRMSIDLLTGEHWSHWSERYTCMGEMFFQQFIYNPFSGLLLSACSSNEDYKADEVVSSSLPCKFRETASSPWQIGCFECKPDSAISMHSGLDTFAMMELKPPNPRPGPARFDEDKCIGMLSSTLIRLDKHNIDTSKLYLPFLIGYGYTALLYTVHLEPSGTTKIPKVSLVGNSFRLCENYDRFKLFVIFSTLIHNAKTILKKQNESEAMKKYRTFLVYSLYHPKGYANPFSTSKCKSTEKSDTTTSERTRSSSHENNKAKEELASQAAKCNGLFRDIELPWPRSIFFGEDHVSVEYQQQSPYYFLGTCSRNGKRCFLKIWREDDRDFHDASHEMKYLIKAQKNNVKVARLVTDEELVRVEVAGIVFNVLATEYIQSSTVTSVSELVDLTLSLMQVVNELHENAGVLHCDIKPGNIRWDVSNHQVYLIDFGHAQMAENAKHYRATKDFEAPEIREEMLPHSHASDTFSVGATILWFCDDYKRRMGQLENELDSRLNDLYSIGKVLSASLVNRKSLKDGIFLLEEALGTGRPYGDNDVVSRFKRPCLVDPRG